MPVNPMLLQALMAAELSPLRSRALLKELGSLHEVSPKSVATAGRLSPAEAKRAEEIDLASAERAFAKGARFLTDDDYPPLLSECELRPLALATLGDSDFLARPTVGIVGTRGATAYGKAAAKKFAEALAAQGAGIVSGGALGIDAAAHEGALAVGGKTAAVLAGGLDRLYPAIHASLFRRISQSGCLLSSFAFGVKPAAYRFLQRNIVIAMLSQALLVVEAPERSGALHTAHAAAELGRPVFVVPATIDQVGFRGSHALIRDGAVLVDHPDQVLEALSIEPTLFQSSEAPTPEGPAKAILDSLTIEPVRVEIIAQKTGLSPDELLAELTFLEMDGRVMRDGGGYALVP